VELALLGPNREDRGLKIPKKAQEKKRGERLGIRLRKTMSIKGRDCHIGGEKEKRLEVQKGDGCSGKKQGT